MADTHQTTTHLALPKPHLGNQLSADVVRLRDALDMLDAYLHAQQARIPFVKADGTTLTLLAGVSDG